MKRLDPSLFLTKTLLLLVLGSMALALAACQGGSIPVLRPQTATPPAPPTPFSMFLENELVEPSLEAQAVIAAVDAGPAPRADANAGVVPGDEPGATVTQKPTRTSRPTHTLTVTPGPSPTATRTPTNTPTPTRTRWPTITNTITLTPTPPSAALRIQRPGLLSKVSSPFKVEAFIKTGEDGKAWLHLIGEDGRIITEQVLDYGKQVNMRFKVAPEVAFEINAAAETARLELSSRDKNGRTIALSSVDLVLLKAGSDEIFPPLLYWEPYLVRFPKNEAVVSGGTVLVVGLIRPVNDTPVIFELFDTGGTRIGASEMIITPPTGDLSHTPFQIGIPYNVPSSTPARLVIRQQSDGRISGTVAMWSMPLTLEP